MKIDFIISALRGGGAERVLTIMANSLANNHDIKIITLLEIEDSFQLSPEIERLNFTQKHLIPNHTIQSVINLSKYYKSQKNRPDIIISLMPPNNLIAIIIAKMFNIKIFCQEHNSHLKYTKHRKHLTSFIRKFVYPYADLVSILTSFDLDYYKKAGVNVKILPNPCSFSAITSNNHKREKTILAAGRLNHFHHKGFDNLIQLISPVLKKFPDWKLKIAGAGDEGLIHLQNLVKINNLEDKIIFCGFIKDISHLMYESSIFILPSRFEGLPMVLLEAMSQGMACIAYNCKTGPSDIITNRENGFLIEDQNKIKMQEGLIELMSSPQLREKLSNSGIKSLDKFKLDNIIKQYENIFKDITS